jgi:hypothetical protein
MKKTVKNLGASLRARLLDHSRLSKQDFQFVLDRWAAERFLLRLGLSTQRERFVLKGATLFLIWCGSLPRRTRDVDLLGYGSPEIEDVTAAMKEVCSIKAEDGIVFDADAITAEPIREEAEYHGIRVWIPATLDGARTQLQIDIGFGDAVDPAVEEREVPVIIPLDAPRLSTYPPEVVIAEKFQAMVHLGIANSRMKDFFDIWFLSQEQSFQMIRLARALRATFVRRKTELPVQLPTALTDTFLRDPGKAVLWREFLKRIDLPRSPATLDEVGKTITVFVMPAVESARTQEPSESIWSPGGPWNRVEKT